MRQNISTRASFRPFVQVLLTGAVAASTLLAFDLSAQGAPPRPPRPARAGVSADSGPLRPGQPPVAPGTRRRMPGMAQGMGPGQMGPGRPGMGPDAMGPRGMGRPGQGGRRGQANAAAAMLRMRGPLELTDDQVKRLEALQAAPAPQRNEADALRARADLMDAMKGDGNINAARTALERMSRVKNEQMLAGLKVRQDARNVLNATQKARLDNMRGEMRDRVRGAGKRRMQGGRQGGRQRGPGMQGGRGGMQGGMPGGMGPGFAPRRQPGMRQGGQPPMPPRRRRDEQER